MSDHHKLNTIVRVQSIAIILLFFGMGIILDNTYLKEKKDPDILTARGIIIVDANGKERILIGAPIPQSKDRIRDDYDKVEKTYGDWFPPEANFMSVFKEQVNNDAYGMLILDEHGYDKMAIGDPVPDLYYGRRIGPSTGIVINDSTGTERSGYGLIKLKDRYMVSMGFDRNDGYEGMVFSLDDKGEAQIKIREKSLSKSLLLGQSIDKGLFGIQYIDKRDTTSTKTLEFN
ncbi:MAG: hypothetical protein CBB72_000705 [Muricauda sp. TMED12]|nr:MAG: hypothetical protein CBB72_000705 [Muricauda sp. TMED12]